MKPIYSKKPLDGLITSAEPLKDKEKILFFLRSFPPVSITGKVIDAQNGEWTNIDNLDYESGDFYWDSSDIYHFEKYDIKLNDEFVQYVLNRPA